MKIKEVITYKRRELAKEISKKKPCKTKIRRLKESINRHIKEMEGLNKVKKKKKRQRKNYYNT